FRPLLQGRTVFDVAGSVTGAGRLAIERAVIDSETAHVTASGIIDPQAASDFSLQLAARGEAGVPISFGSHESPIDMAVRSASLRAIGTGDQPNVDIEASLASVATKSTRITGLAIALHSDAFDVETLTGPISGNAAAAAIIVDNPTAQNLAAGRVSVEIAGVLSEDRLTVATGSLSSDALSGTFGGSVSLGDGAVTLDMTADVASGALPPAVRGPLGERIAISGHVVRDAEGHVSAEPFSLTSAGLAAEGRIATTGSGIEASIEGRLADVGVLAEGLTGAVTISGTASGEPSSPDFSLTADSEQIAALGREISGVRLTARGTADPASPKAEIALAGTLAGEALSATGSLTTADGRPMIEGMQLALGSNRVSGDVRLGERFLPFGILELDLPDIAGLAGLAGETASGDLSGTVRLDTAEDKARAVVVAQSQSVQRGDLRATDAAVEATISDYLGQASVSGRIRAGSIAAGSTVVSDFDVALDGAGQWTGFDGKARVGEIPATAKGRLRIGNGETTVELAAGQATVAGFEARLASPSTIRIADGGVVFDALTLDVDGATAVVTGSAGSAWDLNATLTAANEGMKLALGTPDSPIDIVLRSASLKALGAAGTPALDLAASLSSASTGVARLESLDVMLHSDAFDIASRTGPVTGNAAAAAISLNNAALQPLITGRLEASLAGTLGADTLEIANGSVASDAVTGRFAGNVSLATGRIVLRLDADLASSALPAPFRGVLAERSVIAGTLIRDAEGRISADEVSLQSGALVATGSAFVDGNTLQASLTGSLGDVGLLSEAVSGAAEFAVEAAGSIAAPDLTVTVASDRIEAAGREITALQLTASGRADRANPSGSLTLTGNVAGERLAAKASIDAAGGRPAINDLELTLGPNRLSGNLGIGERLLPSGTLALQMPDIAPVAALAGETASGDLAGTVRLETVESGPRIVVEAQSNSLVRGNVSAAGTTIAATIEDYLTAPTISGRIRAATVTTGGTVIRDADVTLSREPGWTLFDGGATVTGVPARAQGRIRIEGGETTVELTRGEATVRGIKASVAQPSTIRIADGGVVFDALTLDVDGATAVITGSAGSAWDLNATLTAPNDGMKLALGTPESPIDIVLRSASLRALGDRRAPKIDAAASLSSVATRDARLASVDISLQSEAFDIASRTGSVTGTAAA
ncbi:MAG: translocation/assembly module TamB, partial [Rhizobiaceae bacterium]|nr:translocation/assembly module TamB [Rhizobiaceae bacterium]